MPGRYTLEHRAGGRVVEGLAEGGGCDRTWDSLPFRRWRANGLIDLARARRRGEHQRRADGAPGAPYRLRAHGLGLRGIDAAARVSSSARYARGSSITVGGDASSPNAARARSRRAVRDATRECPTRPRTWPSRPGRSTTAVVLGGTSADDDHPTPSRRQATDAGRTECRAAPTRAPVRGEAAARCGAAVTRVRPARAPRRCGAASRRPRRARSG